MIKWILIGLVLFGAYLWFSSKSVGSLTSTSAAGGTKANSTNSGFNLSVGVGTSGISIGW